MGACNCASAHTGKSDNKHLMTQSVIISLENAYLSNAVVTIQSCLSADMLRLGSNSRIARAAPVCWTGHQQLDIATVAMSIVQDLEMLTEWQSRNAHIVSI